MDNKAAHPSKVLLAAIGAALLLAAPPAHAAKARKSKPKARAAAGAVKHEALTAQGLEHLEAQRFDSAIANFSKAVKADPSDSAAYFLLGYAHYQRGFSGGNPETANRMDALEAISAFTTVLEIDPKLTRLNSPYKLFHSLALCYETTGSDEKAIDSYRKAFQLAPHNPMLPLYAARLRFRLNEMDKSIANMSLSLRKAREQKQEKVLLNHIKTDPYFSAMLRSPAHRKVLSTYDHSLRAAPSMEDEETLAMRDAVRDVPGDQRGRIVQESMPDSEVAKLLGSADEEFHFRRYREAIDAYNATLRKNQEAGALNPTQLSLIYERMGAAYNKLGLSEGAIKSLQYAITSMPFNAAAHYQMALAYSVSGKFKESVKSLGQAFSSAPSDGELRKLMLLAKTDSELDPLRDLPGYHKVLGSYAHKLTARR